MSLTTDEGVAIRRFMWYGMLGNQNVQAFGYRWATNFGLLQFRISNLLPQEEAYVRTLISQCETLEQGLLNVQADMDTASAGPWKRNPQQLKENIRLYTFWRKKMCEFFQLPPGPAFATSSQISVVV